MANVPADLRYTKEHEWAKLEGDKARIGITAFAQEQLGDVVFVELPKVGAKVTAMKTFGVVESVKAVSDLFAPLSGEVVEVNAELPKKPEVVNADPYGKGWMIVIKLANAKEWDGLMSAGDYEKLDRRGGALRPCATSPIRRPSSGRCWRGSAWDRSRTCSRGSRPRPGCPARSTCPRPWPRPTSSATCGRCRR